MLCIIQYKLSSSSKEENKIPCNNVQIRNYLLWRPQIGKKPKDNKTKETLSFVFVPQKYHFASMASALV